MIAPGRATVRLDGILQPGERVLWASRPDARSIVHSKRLLWWIGLPWIAAVTALYGLGAVSGPYVMPLFLVGVALNGAPLIMLFERGLTIYAITDRRILIARQAPARPPLVSCAFEAMDRELEIVETSAGAGHLYFASGHSPKARDVDFTGKLAFRDIANVKSVAKILDGVRRAGTPA